MIGAAACILGLFYAAGTVAQDVTARYAMKDVEGGLIRLDTQTGTVSHCSKKVTDWVCEAVADERKAYQDEITRLTKENEDLRKKMASDAEARKKGFPGDQEFEQAMNFVEKFMRRFFEFAKSMKDQIGKET
jgi:hypothetical protein